MRFALGDKVMQLENDYDREVYNGDLGRVMRIDREQNLLTVEIDGRPLSYAFAELDALAPAYATTVHKAQGSEYPVVVLPLARHHGRMLRRNLVYTAITRARRLVVLVVEGSSLELRDRRAAGAAPLVEAARAAVRLMPGSRSSFARHHASSSGARPTSQPRARYRHRLPLREPLCHPESPMTDRDLDLRLLAACAIAREAGKLAYDYFGRRAQLEIEHKGMQDLVSVADRAVEDLIRARLSGAFPDDDLLGEEGGGAARRPGAGLWVIDPIDGTANFLRGMPYWSVALAYVVERSGRDRRHLRSGARRAVLGAPRRRRLPQPRADPGQRRHRPAAAR